ncbi:hypothetical protein ACVWY3_008051 [Bradyrhizobium sp. USDA 4486]
MADERESRGRGERSNGAFRCRRRGGLFLLVIPGRDEVANPESRGYATSLSLQIPGSMLSHRPGMTRFERQLTRFQVWPPQNMPPKAQPCTRSAFAPFIAMVES